MPKESEAPQMERKTGPMRIKKFFQEKVFSPLLVQLKKGATPKNLALSAATGMITSLIPFWMASTLICILLGVVAKMNHVALQASNQIMTIFQIAMIPVYLKGGEYLFGLPPTSLSPTTMISLAKADPGAFFSQYGGAVAAANVAWLISAPPLIFIAYRIFLPIFERFAAKKEERVA